MEDAMHQVNTKEGIEWRVRDSVSTAAHLLKSQSPFVAQGTYDGLLCCIRASPMACPTYGQCQRCLLIRACKNTYLSALHSSDPGHRIGTSRWFYRRL